jgi:hypothetical protein
MYIKKQAQQPPDSEPGFRAGKCIKMHKLRNTITKWTPAIRRLLGIIKNASKQGVTTYIVRPIRIINITLCRVTRHYYKRQLTISKTMMSRLLKLDVFVEVKVRPRILAAQRTSHWTLNSTKKSPPLLDEFEANQRQARQAKGFTK